LVKNLKFKIKNSQKGVSLVIIFFVMTIITAITLSISEILLNQVKMISDIGNSVSSLVAADSGGEKTLYYDRKKPPLGGQVRGLCNVCNTCPTDISDPTGDPGTHCNGCTLTPLAVNGCNLALCKNCQLDYYTNFAGRKYTVYATVTTPLGNPLNSVFYMDSRGLFRDITRKISLTGN